MFKMDLVKAISIIVVIAMGVAVIALDVCIIIALIKDKKKNKG